MHKSQLINILKTFSKEDWESFDRFVCSPFFYDSENPKVEDVFVFYQYISQHKNDLDNSNLAKEIIYKKLLFNLPVKHRENRLSKLKSALKKILEKYIVFKYTYPEENLFQQQLAMARFYNAKSKGKSIYARDKFKELVKKLTKIVNKEKFKDKKHFFQSYMLEHEKFENESFFNTKKRTNLNIQEALESLEKYFLISLLDYLSAYQEQRKFSKNTLIPIQFSNYRANVRPRILPFLHIPIIEIYDMLFTLMQLQESGEDFSIKYLKDYLESLNKHENEISREKLLTFFTHARNFCTAQYNKGHIEYLSILLSLYQEHLAKGYLYVEGTSDMLSITYTNIVFTGIKLGEFSWVEQFIKKYKNRITGNDDPEEVYYLNLANYFFHIKKYDKVWGLTGKRYKDQYNNILIQRLVIKLYVEENQDSEFILGKLATYKVFVHRELSDRDKKINYGFISFLQKILKLIDKPYSKEKKLEELHKLENEIGNASYTAEREWLLSYINRLKNAFE